MGVRGIETETAKAVGAPIALSAVHSTKGSACAINSPNKVTLHYLKDTVPAGTAASGLNCANMGLSTVSATVAQDSTTNNWQCVFDTNVAPTVLFQGSPTAPSGAVSPSTSGTSSPSGTASPTTSGSPTASGSTNGTTGVSAAAPITVSWTLVAMLVAAVAMLF